MPFTAVGWTEAAGFSDPAVTYNVAVTLIRVEEDPRAAAIRDHWTRSVLGGITGVDGYVGHSVTTLDEDGSGYGDDDQWAWTYTVWRDEAALDAFVESDLHNEGLPELGPVITSFSSGRWTAEASVVPEPWDSFWERLEQR